MEKFSLNIRDARKKGEKEEIKKIDDKIERERAHKNHFEDIFNRR
jgi:hypothetical protein